MRSKWLSIGFGGVAVIALLSGWAPAASAQSGLGGLRGAVIDQQGAGLPGVTVTATSPDVLRPQSDVTNERGEYRLGNLAPGTYTVTAELPGFATFKRDGILVRVGSTFAVDITMQLSTVQETDRKSVV